MAGGSPIDRDEQFESLFGSLDLETEEDAPKPKGAAPLESEDVTNAFENLFSEPKPEPDTDLELEAQAAKKKARPAELPKPKPEPPREKARKRAGARSLFWALLLSALLLYALSNRSELMSIYFSMF